MKRARVLKASECKTVSADWGGLTWYAGAELGNSDDMTVGECVIKPGCANPSRHHPNCAEVLVVRQGTIAHVIEEGREVVVNPGDVITVPPHLPHQARNIGDVDAVLFIAFSSANRQTEGA